MASLRVYYSIALLCLLSLSASALPPTGSPAPNPSSPGIFDEQQYINANNLLGMVSNNGLIFNDNNLVFTGRSAGLFYPYLSVQQILSGELTKTLVFSSGIWLGGKVDGRIRVAVAEFNTEYWPGPMIGGAYDPAGETNPDYKVYKLYADSMAENPNQDYLSWPAGQGASFNEGIPALYGDQTLWSVYNDANPSAHNSNPGHTTPLGIEIRQSVWADSTGKDLNIVPNLSPYVISAVHTSSLRPTAYVAHPDEITGHDYLIVVRPDSITVKKWDLIDVTTGSTVLTDQITDTATADGVALTVFTPTFGVAPGDPGRPFPGWDIPNGMRQFSYAGGAGDLELEGFHGALGWNAPYTYFAGEPNALPVSSLKNVQLRLASTDDDGNFGEDDEDVSYGYRYLRRAENPPVYPAWAPFITNPVSGYAYQAFAKNVPLSAWNMDVDPPQRLAVGFLENNVTGGSVDGFYWPPIYWNADNVEPNGPREWLFIFDRPYSETPDPSLLYPLVDSAAPILYMATWARLNEYGWNDGDEFAIHPFTGLTSVDSFTFTATRPGFIASTKPSTMYVKYDLFNKGGNTITGLYIGLWSDPDLGAAKDDLVGCDTTLGTYFCYNGYAIDSMYGGSCPAVGFSVLQGLIVPSPGDTARAFGSLIKDFRNLPPHAFIKYINGTDPSSSEQTYAFLEGNCKESGLMVPCTYDGAQTRFVCSGDPVTMTGDLDTDPADRRMMVSLGPITFAPGDSQQVILKWAVGQGDDYLGSISALKKLLTDEPPYPPCCIGRAGNINGRGVVDLPDLSMLVSFLTLVPTPALPCQDEADVNASSGVDLWDLTAMVDYLTKRPSLTLPRCIRE